MDEWNRQKKKGYHQMSVDRVGFHRHRMRSVEVCYNPKCLTWFKCNVNYVYVTSILDTLPLQADFQM